MKIIITADTETTVGIGFSSNFVTVYNSEVSPAHLRSMMIGLYQTGINIGTLIGACVDQGTHAMSTRMAYRIPLITQLIFPTVVVILVWFFPDTPSQLYELSGPTLC